MHGANRIGGSALPECSVFGQIAGENAALHALFAPDARPEEGSAEEEFARLDALIDKGRKGQVRPIALIRRLQEVMYDKVGVLRNGPGLTEAIREIRELKARAWDMKINPSRVYNNEWIDAIDALFMLDLGEISARAAMARTETRGAHFREDFSREDDANWARHSLAFKKDGRLQLSTRPVTVTRPEV
jgi:succinate dehydrogenase / fumarate reductase flavoprotein subunit